MQDGGLPSRARIKFGNTIATARNATTAVNTQNVTPTEGLSLRKFINVFFVMS